MNKRLSSILLVLALLIGSVGAIAEEISGKSLEELSKELTLFENAINNRSVRISGSGRFLYLDYYAEGPKKDQATDVFGDALRKYNALTYLVSFRGNVIPGFYTFIEFGARNNLPGYETWPPGWRLIQGTFGKTRVTYGGFDQPTLSGLTYQAYGKYFGGSNLLATNYGMRFDTTITNDTSVMAFVGQKNVYGLQGTIKNLPAKTQVQLNHYQEKNAKTQPTFKHLVSSINFKSQPQILETNVFLQGEVARLLETKDPIHPSLEPKADSAAVLQASFVFRDYPVLATYYYRGPNFTSYKNAAHSFQLDRQSLKVETSWPFRADFLPVTLIETKFGVAGELKQSISQRETFAAFETETRGVLPSLGKIPGALAARRIDRWTEDLVEGGRHLYRNEVQYLYRSRVRPLQLTARLNQGNYQNMFIYNRERTDGLVETVEKQIQGLGGNIEVNYNLSEISSLTFRYIRVDLVDGTFRDSYSLSINNRIFPSMPLSLNYSYTQEYKASVFNFAVHAFDLKARVSF